MISDDGQTCTVTFDGYGTTEIVRVDELMSRDWEPPSLTVERHKPKSSRLDYYMCMHKCTCTVYTLYIVIYMYMCITIYIHNYMYIQLHTCTCTCTCTRTLYIHVQLCKVHS